MIKLSFKTSLKYCQKFSSKLEFFALWLNRFNKKKRNSNPELMLILKEWTILLKTSLLHLGISHGPISTLQKFLTILKKYSHKFMKNIHSWKISIIPLTKLVKYRNITKKKVALRDHLCLQLLKYSFDLNLQ